MTRVVNPPAIELIGRRWTGAIISAMRDGAERYGEIRAAIPGISDRVFVQRLVELEDNGIIDRNVAASRPVRVTYRLTPKGKALAPVLDCVTTWAAAWPVRQVRESQQ